MLQTKMINLFAWLERKLQITVDVRLPRGRTKPDDSTISKEQRRGTSIVAEALASPEGLEPGTKRLAASAFQTGERPHEQIRRSSN